MMKKIVMIFSLCVVVFLAGCGSNTIEQKQKIAFAQCLTDAGFKMYGADRCGHCKDQKELFGHVAFDKVDYIECTKQETLCNIAEVTGYPTWIGPDYKQASVHSFDQLSKASGCIYEQPEQD